jgi:DNA-directed RNA polymerase specialized sigma24 family protein
MTMNSRDPRTDSELAELAARDDLDAAKELGRRYIAGLYDFAVRVTLDQASAQGAAEASLSRSITELPKRPPGLDYHAWLFGVARDECLEGIRQRIRPDAAEGDGNSTLSALDPRFARPPESGADEEIDLLCCLV